MAHSYIDAQILWPLSGESFSCSQVIGAPIIANTTGTRVCGVQTNRTVAERCCEGAAIQEYQCWLYCESQQPINEWVGCTSKFDSVGGHGEFCQGNLKANNTRTLSSFAFRSFSPRLTWVVLAMLFTCFWVGPAKATAAFPADGELVKRQSGSGCTLNIQHNYTSLGRSQKVSPTFDCTNFAGNFCSFEIQVETPLSGNNRTFNGSQAADSLYDAMFDVVSNATNRKFPALSSSNLTRGVAVSTGTSFFLAWTPFSWCVNGTVMGCSSTLDGASDGSEFSACGPTYVDNAAPDSSIQGLLNPVIVG